MFKPDRLNSFLFFSLAFILVLALLPSTGWIARMPLWLRLPGVHENSHAWENEVVVPWMRPGRTVKSDPGDYLQALGTALTENSIGSEAMNAAGARALRSVELRFPGHPSMPAHEIRCWLRSGSLGTRVEDWLLARSKPPASFQQKPGDPERVDGVLQAAIRGEQIDPENAFYPLMHACALMGARRDAEAIEALQIAGQKTGWNEYLLEDADARVHLHERSHGRLSALTATFEDCDTLFPHYSAIRELARVAVYKAILAEQSGNREEGLQIRHALIHVGGLMRADSSYFIPALVGIAVAQISVSRPGGALAPAGAGRSPNESQHVERYCSYLAASGHANEARWVRAQLDAAQRTHDILHRTLSSPEGKPFVPDRARPAIWLIGLWSAAALALCNAIWLLMAAGIAHLRWTRREIAAPVCALLAFLAIIPAWEWAQVRAVADGCSLIGVFVMYYSGTGPWLVPLIATLSFAVPLILSAAILVRALRRRIPPGRAFREGFRGPGAWIGAACLLAYGLLVIGTAVQESHVLHERNRIRVHEGRYYAAMVGAEWPGLPAN